MLLVEVQQEQTLLQDLLQDPSANATLDVPTVQYNNSGFNAYGVLLQASHWQLVQEVLIALKQT